jgi:hypothetical protein
MNTIKGSMIAVALLAAIAATGSGAGRTAPAGRRAGYWRAIWPRISPPLFRSVWMLM